MPNNYFMYSEISCCFVAKDSFDRDESLLELKIIQKHQFIDSNERQPSTR